MDGQTLDDSWLMIKEDEEPSMTCISVDCTHVHRQTQRSQLPGLRLSVRCSQDTEKGAEAQAYLEAHPLTQEQPHMQHWNGGIGSQQMRYKLCHDPI